MRKYQVRRQQLYGDVHGRQFLQRGHRLQCYELVYGAMRCIGGLWRHHIELCTGHERHVHGTVDVCGNRLLHWRELRRDLQWDELLRRGRMLRRRDLQPER